VKLTASTYGTTVRTTLVVVLAVIAALAFLVAYEPTRDFMLSSTALREKIAEYGPLGPVVIICYHVLQVLFAPIPGQPVDLANGYLFGPYLGILTSLIGIFLGSTIAMVLARRFGRPLVHHFLSDRGRRQMDKYLGHRNLWFVFVIFLLPGTPDDLLCFVVGLTRIPLWRAIPVVLIGRTPTVVASVLLGATGHTLNPLQFLGIALGVTVVLLVLLRYTKIEKVFARFGA
jgi:uncharacterized membrane protein YdjX (TVP38/TMEM64 family)